VRVAAGAVGVAAVAVTVGVCVTVAVGVLVGPTTTFRPNTIVMSLSIDMAVFNVLIFPFGLTTTHSACRLPAVLHARSEAPQITPPSADKGTTCMPSPANEANMIPTV